MNYDPKSLKAEEFINHEEILETLEYAEKNKHNLSKKYSKRLSLKKPDAVWNAQVCPTERQVCFSLVIFLK